jgi:hypothetical protein
VPATGLVPDDKQPGRLRDGDGGVGAAAIHRQHLRRRRLEGASERNSRGSPAASTRRLAVRVRVPVRVPVSANPPTKSQNRRNHPKTARSAQRIASAAALAV